jgi:hypothetical protein
MDFILDSPDLDLGLIRKKQKLSFKEKDGPSGVTLVVGAPTILSTRPFFVPPKPWAFKCLVIDPAWTKLMAVAVLIMVK